MANKPRLVPSAPMNIEVSLVSNDGTLHYRRSRLQTVIGQILLRQQFEPSQAEQQTPIQESESRHDIEAI